MTTMTTDELGSDEVAEDVAESSLDEFGTEPGVVEAVQLYEAAVRGYIEVAQHASDLGITVITSSGLTDTL